MQRLNPMTLGALAIGFCGFIYDASTDYRRDVAERPSFAAQHAEASAAGPAVLAAFGPANAFGHSLIVD